MQRINVGVIGGGAAGFFAAIACAETHPFSQVTLIEAGRHPLSKVRISGGGRCNVTHACFEPATLIQYYPRGGKALRGCFSRFQPRHTVDWFRQRGVELKTEADGRMFPVTDDSGTIVNCLMQSAYRAGVTIETGAAVQQVIQQNNRFEVSLKAGETLRYDRLLLATGSSPQGYRIAESLGHTLEAPVPSLFTFTITDPDLRALAGVAVDRVEAKLIVPDYKPLEQIGALLITHWGMSGPAVLKLSAWGARLLHDQHYQATLQINWLPEQNSEQCRQTLLQTKVDSSKKLIASFCPFPLPRRLWQYLIDRAEIKPDARWADLSKPATHLLVQALTQNQHQIQGKGAFKEEFVTCGGVSLKEVDFKTMQSKICPHLYLAGEILDIDGVTGGFNFQSAWTTGWLAGQAMGEP